MSWLQLLTVLASALVFVWRAAYIMFGQSGDRRKLAFISFDLPLIFVISLALFIAPR
jgi:hypothetical protein